MSSSNTINSTYIKALVAMGVSTGLDFTMSKNPNITTSAMIGVATGIGCLAGNYASSMIPSVIPSDSGTNPMYTGQAVQDRALEVVGGYAGITLLQTYQTSLGRRDNVLEKIAVVGVAVAIAEVVDDYLTNQPIAVFT